MRVRVPLPAPLKKQKILVIVGPTSSGKSTLAVELAREFSGEVISADSRQVYRRLDIGTGKVTKREMQGIPHHLLDVASPKKVFTAADFVRLGRKAIADIAKRGKLPIVCGGTGFYIDALLGCVQLPDVPPDRALRARLEKKSAAELFALLKKRDPKRANTIDRHNEHRLIRALEIASSANPSPSTEIKPRYDVLWIGLEWPREKLNERIRERLKARLKRGMIAEAKRLHAGGLSYKRMEALGLEYRSLAQSLQGKLTRAELEEELARDIPRYAKRQMTYWRRNKEISWFKPTEKRTIERTIRQRLSSGR